MTPTEVATTILTEVGTRTLTEATPAQVALVVMIPLGPAGAAETMTTASAPANGVKVIPLVLQEVASAATLCPEATAVAMTIALALVGETTVILLAQLAETTTTLMALLVRYESRYALLPCMDSV